MSLAADGRVPLAQPPKVRMPPDDKLPGKATWAGRRRPMTRRSGFSASSAVEMQFDEVNGYYLKDGQELLYEFSFPGPEPGHRLGFGGWFTTGGDVVISLEGDLPRSVLLQNAVLPIWGKVGSQWLAPEAGQGTIRLIFRAEGPTHVATFAMLCGRVEHEYLDDARPALLPNMWRFAPEANFYPPDGQGIVRVRDDGLAEVHRAAMISLKSCNRCGRYLPVNIDNERAHLSFSNHCKAQHRLPCSHTGFGRIRDARTGEVVELTYGFQLECRFCKKFAVNAALNPQRTAAQMKEDAARRRAIEFLLDHLYKGSPQLIYRLQTGCELADDVWTRFGGRCFKCGTALASPNDMHLDHTRPLALLWPLDGTATCLCGTHNSEKRDRPPVAFYTEDELRRLAAITGLTLDELKDPSPNIEAINLLLARLDWFFDEFLQQPELQRVRDGKQAAELLVKALQKTLSALPDGVSIDLGHEWEERQS